MVTAVFHGVAGDLPPSLAMPLIREFIDRKRLAKLGFTSPLAGLTAEKADWFLRIDSVLDELRRKKNET